MDGASTVYTRARRRGPRTIVPPDESVHCFFAGLEGRVTAISEWGAFIDTVFPQDTGSEFDLVLEGARPVHIRCVSRDPRPGWGMGVEFIEMQGEDERALRNLIDRLEHGEQT